MAASLKISGVALGIAIIASVAACVPDPYSQKDGHTTNTQVPQPYPESYAPPGQPAYAPPQYQPAYAPPQYATTQAQPAYDRTSEVERVSISRGTCDQRFLASRPNRFVDPAAGPLVRGNVQSTMTPVDNGCISLTLEFAQDNQPVVWQNSSNGAQYQVVPVRAYQQPDGAVCREYTTVSMLNGQSISARDIACRSPNGAWQLQS